MWNQLFRVVKPKFSNGSLNSQKPYLLSQLRKYAADSGKDQKLRNRSTFYYIGAVGVAAVGLSYAAVPLYRMFCQAYSYGGTVGIDEAGEKVEQMKRIKDRVIKIKFNADIGASMRWNFKPQQYEIKVMPGETALAFYKAKNPTDHPVIGISTYNVGKCGETS